MRDSQTAEIVVAGGGPVSAFELGHFLYLFRSAYAAALKADVKAANIDQNTARSLVEYMRFKVPYYWYLDLGEDELIFLEIDKHSPLKLMARTTSACIGALTLAVILSGGQADLKNLKFALPPLGVGIEHLREALGAPGPNGGLPPTRRLGQRQG